MVELFPTKISGIMEAHETYIGGKSIRPGATRKPRPNKQMVIGMRERGGRLRLCHVSDLKSRHNEKASRSAHRCGYQAHRDRFSDAYDFAVDKEFQKRHETVNHNRDWVKPGDIDIHTNTIESAFSLLKRGLIGSFHRVSVKHLLRYLAEFENRANCAEDPSYRADRVQGT
jgi:hypothetical protein